MFRGLFAWVGKYERHLSAGAMVGGFVIDNIFFSRIDVLETHLVFLGYILICFISISWLHFLEARSEEGVLPSRFRPLLPIATQFALGGFWSGLLIFYSRGAVVLAAWPFLLLIVAAFIGNEIFRKYHGRLVFTSLLFFFALYSYAIFAVPIVTGSLGLGTFLLSGGAALLAFMLFTRFLRFVAHERFQADVWRIRAGALAVLFLIHFSYFTNLLPPLPLILQSGGIYHEVARSGDTYTALVEPQIWRVFFGAPAELHVAPPGALYAYSAVFAPGALSTTIVHRWERQNPLTKEWTTQSVVSFPIEGGRERGYRGYSVKTNLTPGKWRVNVETARGQLIGRLRFTVTHVTERPPLTREVLDLELREF